MISVVIPAFHCQNTIISVINSILNQHCQNYEIITVIDGKDPQLFSLLKPFPVKIFQLEENRGPAFARNYGAEQATGEILVFIDSDMTLVEGSFDVILKSFLEPNVKVVQGMYDKIPSNPKFITNLAALKKWIDYQPEKLIEVKTIGSELFAIRKSIFLEFTGFNINYTKPTVEDYEFGYRVAQKYTIQFEKDFRGRHAFPNARKIMKNYFIRSREWATLFLQKEKKSFDTGATKTSAVYSGILLWTLIGIWGMIGITNLIQIEWITHNILIFIWITIGLYGLLNFLNRDYLIGFTTEYSWITAIVSVHFIYILESISIMGGAIGILDYVFHRKTKNGVQN